MKKIYLQILACLFVITSVLSSCKLDPILPPDKELKAIDKKPDTGTDTGGGNNTGGGTNTGGGGTNTGGGTSTGGGGTNTGGGGTNTGGGGNTGGGTNTGGDIGIGASGTVIYQIDGSSSVTLTSLATFGYITPEQSMGVYPNGATSIGAFDMSKGLQFSLIFEGKSTGSYKIKLIGAGETSGGVVGADVGTVKVTTYTSNNVQGTFSADVNDANTGDGHKIKGSFNVKK